MKYTVSIPFHRHHDTYATILIAPSYEDSGHIYLSLEADNRHRRDLIEMGRGDPGRGDDIDWTAVRARFY